MKQIWIVVIGLIVLILVMIGLKKSGVLGGKDGIEIEADRVLKSNIVETVSASGKIYPELEVNLSSEVSGEIVQILIEEGDSVNAGDLLIQINPNIYKSMLDQSYANLNQSKAGLANAKARLAQAGSNFDQAQLNFNRNEGLHKSKVISDAEFETAQMAFTSAKAELESATQTVVGAEFSVESANAMLKQARDQLAKTTIYSPVSGTVSKLNVEFGERVVGTSQMPGTELLRIANLDFMEVRVDVSENDIIRVNVGDTAMIDVDAYLDRKFKGTVTQISTSANMDPQQAQLSNEQVTNFTVKIRLLQSSYADLISPENKFPFRPGMSASVDIQTENSLGVMAVPIQCVIARDTISTSSVDSLKTKPSEDRLKNYVFAVVDSKVKMKEVKTGIQDDKVIQILSGLKGDELIVTGPFKAISQDLENGDLVNATDKSKHSKAKEE